MCKTHGEASGVAVYLSPAGNSGEFGTWHTSAPATGKDVISVGSVDKFVTEPSSRKLAKHRVNSTVTPIQNATIYVDGSETIPIVSLQSFCIPRFLIVWVSVILQPNTPDRYNHTVRDLRDLY